MNHLPTRKQWKEGESAITLAKARNACVTGLVAGLLFIALACVFV